MTSKITVQFSGHYICDNFPAWDAAEAFADEIAEVLHLATWISSDPAIAFAHEPFPHAQRAVICHVCRPADWADDAELEEIRDDWVERIAAKHGGEYVGT